MVDEMDVVFEIETLGGVIGVAVMSMFIVRR